MSSIGASSPATYTPPLPSTDRTLPDETNATKSDAKTSDSGSSDSNSSKPTTTVDTNTDSTATTTVKDPNGTVVSVTQSDAPPPSKASATGNSPGLLIDIRA